MIELKNVFKKYGSKDVIKNLSLTVPSGEIFGFLGPNGAGKSTTIKMIVGIEHSDSGIVLVDGISVQNKPIQAKERLAYIPDEPNYFGNITGIKYLNFVSDIFNISNTVRKEKIEYYSDCFEIKDRLKDSVSSYSHGMKQKLSLVSAFVHSPKIIVLDEPMVGLDAKSVKTLKVLLKEHAKNGGTVFYSTHVMDTAERFCDRIAILNDGNIVFSGTFENLKSENGVAGSTLEDIFLKMTEIKG